MERSGYRKQSGNWCDLIAQVKSEPPPWSEEKLHAIKRDDYSRLKGFLSKRHQSQQGVVVLKDVDHIIARNAEAAVSWQSLLRAGKKHLPWNESWWHVEYWLGPAGKEGMSYVVLDGKLLVSRGIYKTALARYILHYANSNTLYGVKVSRWSVDWGLFETCCRLKDICRIRCSGEDVQPRKRKEKTRLEGSWTVEEYGLSLERVESKTGRVLEVLSPADAVDWLADLESGLPRLHDADPSDCLGDIAILA